MKILIIFATFLSQTATFTILHTVPEDFIRLSIERLCIGWKFFNNRFYAPNGYLLLHNKPLIIALLLTSK